MGKIVFNQVAATPISDGNYKPECNYKAIKTYSNCLNSDKSPIKIKAGDILLMHPIPYPFNDYTVFKSTGKIICYKHGCNSSYELAKMQCWDGTRWAIITETFTPEEVKAIPLNEIKELYVVDGLIEGINNTGIYPEGFETLFSTMNSSEWRIELDKVINYLIGISMEDMNLFEPSVLYCTKKLYDFFLGIEQKGGEI